MAPDRSTSQPGLRQMSAALVALLVLFAVVVGVLLSVSCGSEATCDPRFCAGCCDQNGVCQPAGGCGSGGPTDDGGTGDDTGSSGSPDAAPACGNVDDDCGTDGDCCPGLYCTFDGFCSQLSPF